MWEARLIGLSTKHQDGLQSSATTSFKIYISRPENNNNWVGRLIIQRSCFFLKCDHRCDFFSTFSCCGLGSLYPETPCWSYKRYIDCNTASAFSSTENLSSFKGGVVPISSTTPLHLHAVNIRNTAQSIKLAPQWTSILRGTTKAD